MVRNEFKYVECTDCEEGEVYIDTSYSCGVVRGECCGGCGHSVECEECNGTGELELEIEPMHSFSNKTRNRKLHSNVYQHHFNKRIKRWRRWRPR